MSVQSPHNDLGAKSALAMGQSCTMGSENFNLTLSVLLKELYKHCKVI